MSTPTHTQMKDDYIYWPSYTLLFERMLCNPYTVTKAHYFKSLAAGSVKETVRGGDTDREEEREDNGMG